jgi:hypothetical protein
MSESVHDSGSDPWDQYARVLKHVTAKTRQLAETVADGSLGEKDRAEALVKLIREGNKITDIEYSGHKITDDSDFKQQKELAKELFEDLARLCAGTSESVLAKFLDLDQDYVVTLWQATKAASSYNQHAPSIDSDLRLWFVLGFYASAYELACKPLTKLAQALFATRNLSCGHARQLLKERMDGKYGQIADDFDNFLRNAIDHAQYSLNDQTGLIDAWNLENGVKTTKRPYHLDDVFKKTVRLLFLIVSLYVVYNEKLEATLVQQYGILVQV